MEEYLKRFYERIGKEWKGSLIKPSYLKGRNSKEYLNKLAKLGEIERVRWGWYWIPDEIIDIWDFLEKDKNFKMVAAQTAASFWNNDFIHRDIYIIKVRDESYGRALENFAKERNWEVEIGRIGNEDYISFVNLSVESVTDTIVDCFQNWAFVDGLSTLYENRGEINLKELIEKAYWKRISGTKIRVRQALEYAFSKLNEHSKEEVYPSKYRKLKNDFLKAEIDEAVEKVMEFV